MSLKHAILAMLEIKEGTGYDIVSRFKDSIGCFWSASHQQVYKELSDLSQKGWLVFEEVTQKGKPAKVYALTESGSAELNRWLHSPTKPGSYKDPFLVKVYASHGQPPAFLLNELRQKIEEHGQTLAAYRQLDQWLSQLPAPKYHKFRLPHATLKFGLRLEEAWLEWAAELKQMLEAAQFSASSTSEA